MAEEITIREHSVAFEIEVRNLTMNRNETIKVHYVPQGASKLNPRYEIMAPDGYVFHGHWLHTQLERTRSAVRLANGSGDLDIERCDGGEERGCVCAEFWAKKTREALADLLDLGRQYLDEAGPCDHAVNICVCDIKRRIEAAAEILDVLVSLGG